ncbi:hypothetical protein I4U23_002313 [Adineta vaga]|nr:hypothetical protein I4U23_002313 [Adineta vaga]
MASEIILSDDSRPHYIDNRDFGNFSDHVTVWIDTHIGVDDGYTDFKAKFDTNIQVLQSNNPIEEDIDDESILYADQNILKNLRDEVYCLKYFPTPEKGLKYIRNNPQKKIFFISSGTIGKCVVPELVDLYQIYGIYIFCGNISFHTKWAYDYADIITAMLEHQDDLLQRLTRDIADCVEKKGDLYQQQMEYLKARNCYA